MRRFFASVVMAAALLITAPACSVIETDVPPVPDSTMVAVMIDLHLLNARSELQRDTEDSLRVNILAYHGLDTTQYAQAIEFYADEPERLLEIYAHV